MKLPFRARASRILFLAVLLTLLISAVGQDKDDAWAMGKERGTHAINADASTEVYWDRGIVTLWDVATGKQLDEFNWPGGRYSRPVLAFSPDDKALALVEDKASTIHILDLGSKKVLRELRWSAVREITAIAFAPDGRMLAAVVDNTAVRIWAVATGEQLREVAMHPDEGRISIAFSPDGKTLAIARRGAATIHLYNVMTGTEFRELKGVDDGSVHAVVFSPDGQMLVAIDRGIENFGPALRIFDMATGKERRQCVLAYRGIDTSAFVGFSRDGRRLIAYLTGRFQSWAVTSQDQDLPSFTGPVAELSKEWEKTLKMEKVGC